MRTVEPSLTRRTVRAVAWSYASWITTKGVLFLTTAILARLLDPEAFGVVGFALVAIAYLTVFRDLGLESALIQTREDLDDAADTVFTINLFVGGALTIALTLAAPAIAGFFEEPEVAPILRVLAPIFLIRSLGSTHNALLRRDLNFGRRAGAEVGSAAVRAIVAVGAAVLGLGAWALVWGQVAGAAVLAALFWLVSPWRPRLRIRRDLVRPLLAFGGPILGVGVVHAIAGNLDYLVVGKALGAEALGLYTIAYRIPELLILSVVAVLSKAAFPAFAEAQHDPDRLRRGFLDSIRYVQLVVMPVGVGIALTADPLVRTAFGDQWIEAVPIVRLLAVFALISSAMVADGDVYKAVGRPGLLARLAVLKVILLGIGLAIGVRYGLVGIALAHVFSTIAAKAVRTVVILRVLDVGVRNLLRSFVPSTLATAGMTVVVLPVMAMTSAWPATLQLLVAALSGAAVYVSLALRADRDVLRRLIGNRKREDAASTGR